MKLYNTVKALTASSFILFGTLLATQSQAATLQMAFDTVFSGTAPTGLMATFEDTVPGTVQVTLSASAAIGDSFISGVYLNVDPAINPNDLTYSFVSASPGATPIGVTKGMQNCCKADGAGRFDIWLDFSTAAATRFEQSESVVFTLSLAGLTADSFAFQTLDGGSKGNYYGAAHIQQTGPNGEDSGWVGASDRPVPPAAIPLPTAAWLFGSGLIGLVGVARRKHRLA